MSAVAIAILFPKDRPDMSINIVALAVKPINDDLNWFTTYLHNSDSGQNVTRQKSSVCSQSETTYMVKPFLCLKVLKKFCFSYWSRLART